MKRILIILLLTLPISVYAQIKVVEIDRQADTLVFTFSSGMDVVNVYKNENGYFLAEESTNMFDPLKRFYLGKDKEESIKSVQTLIDFCKEDVDTTIKILDATGNEFIVKTDIGTGGYYRKPTPQTSNMIRIKNDELAGWVHFRKKTLEELLTLLSKQS